MKEKLLSIIVPVFNVEKYLEKCISSLLNQTYKNIEIILINDGSTDGSTQICEGFKDHENIVYLSQKNKGQAAARNAGLDVAKGEYIAFLDSDDFVDANMYKTLIEALENNNCDIAACASRYVDAQYRPIMKQEFTNALVFISNQDLLGDMYCNRRARSEVWNKVFKKDVIGETRFKLGQKFEEVYFDGVVFLRSNGCIFLDKPLHYYLQARRGNTNSSFTEAKMCVFGELEGIKAALENLGDYDNSKKISAMKLFFSMLLGMQAYKYHASRRIKVELKRIFDEEKKANKDNDYSKNLRRRVFLYSINPRVLMMFMLLIKKSIDL